MLKEKDSTQDTEALLFGIAAILLIYAIAACVGYARYGWDYMLVQVGPKHVDTVKTIITIIFVVAVGFISFLMLVSWNPAPDIDNVKKACLFWLVANIFNLAVIFCVWTGLISYWIINVLLVPLVLLQGLLAFVMILSSDFEDLMKGHGTLHFATLASVIFFHLFFPGILIARVYYRFA